MGEKTQTHMQLSVELDRQIVQSVFPFVSSTDLYVGTDESGRGPLAGPLVVAAAVFDHGVHICKVRDSKKLSLNDRLSLEVEIKEKALAYHVEVISIDIIAEKNVYQASKWGMISCFQEIRKKIPRIQFLLTDAMKISKKELPGINVLSLIKGDAKLFHIAAASILAKTARDRIMKEAHLEFPQYGWDHNKGYPTKFHRDALSQFGITPYHRKSYRLVSDYDV